jgi:hypothetical protein
LEVVAATTTFTNKDSNNESRTFQSNATGDTITFQNGTNASATSFEPGITGFGPNNTMRNMTNPIYQMEENPLQLEENPLVNLTNPLK